MQPFSSPSVLASIIFSSIIILSIPYGVEYASAAGLNSNSTDLQDQINKLSQAQYLLFPHIYRAFISAGRSPENYNISSVCQEKLSLYYWALNHQKRWAWRFYDATGKQGAGLFTGGLTWKGNFDECLNTYNYSSKVTRRVLGQKIDEPKPQYCSVFIKSPAWLLHITEELHLPFPVPVSPFIADVCVPADCTKTDIEEIVQTFVAAESWGDENFTVFDVLCHQRRNIGDDPAALFSASVILALIGCVILGTAYDIYLRREKFRVKRGPEILIGYHKDSKQYGILKVILAPQNGKKLVRRNTIGGYEKNNEYALSEVKVDREKIKMQKTSSLPDVLDDLEAGLEFIDADIKLSGDPVIPLPHITGDKNIQDRIMNESIKSSLLESSKSPVLETAQTINEENQNEFQMNNNILNLDSGKLETISEIPENGTNSSELFQPLLSPAEKSYKEKIHIPKSPSPKGKTLPPTIRHKPSNERHGSIYERSISDSTDEETTPEKSFASSWQRFKTVPKEINTPTVNPTESMTTEPQIVVKSQPLLKARTLLQAIIISFSFRRSTKRILAEGSPDILFCLNGVRVLSIGWIVLGTVYMLLYLNPDVVDNHVDGVKMTQSLWVQAVINTTLAADSFYILSGSLAAYNFMKLKYKSKRKKMTEVLSFKEYLKMIFHRLVRYLAG